MLRRLADIMGFPYGHAVWYSEVEVSNLFASTMARGCAIWRFA